MRTVMSLLPPPEDEELLELEELEEELELLEEEVLELVEPPQTGPPLPD